jgi:hypothetical protein
MCKALALIPSTAHPFPLPPKKGRKKKNLSTKSLFLCIPETEAHGFQSKLFRIRALGPKSTIDSLYFDHQSWVFINSIAGSKKKKFHK